MSNFSTAEKSIAKFLSRFPQLKLFLKYLYQALAFLVFKKKYRYRLHPNHLLKVHAASKTPTFGGYYDKNLIQKNNVIYHCVNDRQDIRTSSHIRSNFSEISKESRSWNWQQGAMLQWFSENSIIYNNFENGKYISVIHDIVNNKERKLIMPIYAVSSNNSYALTLNFSRLANLRPDYGYFNLPYKKITVRDEEDGIFKVDMEKNKSELIISLEQLKNFNPRAEMKDATHKVNHIMIAPDDERFMFLHRWYTPAGVKYSRLITADKNGKNLFLLADDQMVSHCNWKNNQEIIGWMRKKEGDHYYYLKDLSTDYAIVGQNILTEDGHPSITKDGRWMLTDTYPDKSRMSHLLLFNLKNNELIELGEFFSPLKYRGFSRCDLHPRFSDDECLISFDSVHDGTRRMYIMDISKIINEYAQ
jgi:hypothetical protein